MNYCIGGYLDAERTDTVKAAIAHWQQFTQMQFHDDGSPCVGTGVGRASQEVRFTTSPYDYCLSSVGMQSGDTPQFIQVSAPKWCDVGTLIHEIGHTVGLEHEQSRPDRDTYVVVHKENVADDHATDFDIINDGAQMLGPYDCQSLMHYLPDEFSNGNGPTIEPKSSDCKLGNDNHLSAGDIDAVKKLYGY